MLDKIPDVNIGTNNESHLQKCHLQHFDADVVDRSISKTRIQLLGPETLQIFHDKTPELDDIIPVHIVTGIYQCRLGSQEHHLQGKAKTTWTCTC